MDEESEFDWDDEIAAQREAYIDDLVSRGLRLTEENSVGARSDATLRNSRVTISIRNGFPYVAPRVVTNVEADRSWHQEGDGGLCLYTDGDKYTQPWREADALLERVDQWFSNNDAGWPEDAPALDIEQYLGLDLDPRYVLYDGLGRLIDDYVRVESGNGLLTVLGPGKLSKKSAKGLLSGYVCDLGEVTRPPRSWSELLDSVSDGARIRGAIERGRVDLVLVRYSRDGQQGAVAVTLSRGKRGGVRPLVALSGSTDRPAVQMRAGVNASRLAKKHVYVIGAGAIGSHICDGLARAGVGHITVRDFDLLTPGNMTRHLLGFLPFSGMNKARAVAVALRQRAYSRSRYTYDETGLTSPTEVKELLDESDLVVDATADGSVTSMLEDAARRTKRRIVTAYIQNDGQTYRVDIVPPFAGAAPLPAVEARPPASPARYEGGCGDPVSPTPPWAVAEAAAMAVRHIVGVLLGEPTHPAGEVREVA